MWAILKLLASLSASIPALRDIFMDIASAFQSMQAESRRRAKDEAVDIAISDVERRLRDSQSGQRKDADGKK